MYALILSVSSLLWLKNSQNTKHFESKLKGTLDLDNICKYCNLIMLTEMYGASDCEKEMFYTLIYMFMYSYLFVFNTFFVDYLSHCRV